MRTNFDRENIQENIPGIILLSHGALALGMMDTAGIVLGNTYNLAAFSLDPEDNPETFRSTFLAAAESFPAGVVIFVDMFGGSPCNQLLIGASDLKVSYCAFAGMNLPLLSEALSMRELYTGEALQMAIAEIIPHAIMDLGDLIQNLKEE